MTLTFLFWNIHRNPLYDSLVSLCHEREIDFLILAEVRLDKGLLLSKLNGTETKYYPIYGSEGHLTVFSRYPKSLIKLVDLPKLGENDIMTYKFARSLFFRVEIGYVKFNLVPVHLRSPSSGEHVEKTQFHKIQNLNSRIRLFESSQHDNTTVVVGDFNLDPFDDGLVQITGFHAMMSRTLVNPTGRIVDRYRYPYFYNPMWNKFGCERVTGKPTGTYYKDRGETKTYYWHIADQVLIRPSLLNNFEEEDLQILEHDGISGLRLDGIPNADKYSDHLPLVFKLKF